MRALTIAAPLFLGLLASAYGCGNGGAGGTPGTTSSSTGTGGAPATTSSSTGTGGAPGTTSSSTTGTGGACGPVDDQNPCTVDVCENGLPAHHPVPAGSPCSMGGTLCDDQGSCVACLAPADCAGTDDACQARTCAQGTCGHHFTAAGTPLPIQTAGDCKKAVCDGNGAAVAQNDDTDPPDDQNACTADVCSAGVGVHVALAQGTVCGAGLVCSGGTCVGCIAPADCPGSDDACHARTCQAGACGVSFTAANTPLATQTPHDCLKAVCDGSGNTTTIPDDTDAPLDDGNACTAETCTGGLPGHPAKANGLACNDGDACTVADTCQAGLCTAGSPMVCGGGQSCVAGLCVTPPCTGNPAFPELPALPVGAGPASIVAADVDVDTKPDLIIANSADNTVSVLINNGGGAFAPKVSYATGASPNAVAAADLNGDGKPDLVTGNQSGNTVSVLINNGNGTFAAKIDYPAGAAPGAVVAVDLNGDGKPDLAVVDRDSYGVSVLLNNGNGTFATITFYATGSTAGGAFPDPGAVAAADVNGDGKPDLIVANIGNNSVSVLLNNGNGTFAAKVDYPTGAGPTSVAAADLNGDGKPDLAVANRNGNTVSVLLNNGNGTFAAKIDYPTGAGPTSVAAADLNGDGKPDLATANANLVYMVSVLLNNGNGTFIAKLDSPTGPNPYAIAAADLNGDGKLDLATANYTSNTVRVLINHCTP